MKINKEFERAKPHQNYEYEFADDSIIFHGLENCIIGTDQFNQPVYDYIKMIDTFTSRDGMNEFEAIEWIEFNVVGTNAGIGFVVLYY